MISLCRVLHLNALNGNVHSLSWNYGLDSTTYILSYVEDNNYDLDIVSRLLGYVCLHTTVTHFHVLRHSENKGQSVNTNCHCRQACVMADTYILVYYVYSLCSVSIRLSHYYVIKWNTVLLIHFFSAPATISRQNV